MKRTYYNPNNGKSAILTESTASVIFSGSGKKTTFKSKCKAGSFLNKHGYTLISIKAE